MAFDTDTTKVMDTRMERTIMVSILMGDMTIPIRNTGITIFKVKAKIKVNYKTKDKSRKIKVKNRNH